MITNKNGLPVIAHTVSMGNVTVPFFCRKRAVFLRGIRMLSGHLVSERSSLAQPVPQLVTSQGPPVKGSSAATDESKSGLFQPRGRNSAFAFTDPGSAAALPRLAPLVHANEKTTSKGHQLLPVKQRPQLDAVSFAGPGTIYRYRCSQA